ncbi:terpene synthase family protein [Embleya sp. AB8]|uniref:terpene synthase family protein n=1 Tax=Embleya sp. AB8 TaxID=3156304 RepID=UPI003C71D43A
MDTIGAQAQVGGFDCPFPERVNPHLAATEEPHLEWIRAFRLVAGEEAMPAYLSWRMSRLAARTYPECDATQLTLMADYVGFTFVVDDQFDCHPELSSAAVRELIDPLLEVLDWDTTADFAKEPPGVRAWADLWHRLCQGMPRSWVRRCAASFRDYYEAVVAEAVVRESGRTPGVDEFVELRLDSSGVRPAFDLIERAGRFTLAESLVADARFGELCEQGVRHIGWVNDVFSANRELFTAGQRYNLVPVLEEPQDYTWFEARKRAYTMADDSLARFLRIKGELPGIYRRLDLSEQERTDADTYVRGMENWMGGHIRWYPESSRYVELTVADVCPSPVFFGPTYQDRIRHADHRDDDPR